MMQDTAHAATETMGLSLTMSLPDSDLTPSLTLSEEPLLPQPLTRMCLCENVRSGDTCWGEKTNLQSVFSGKALVAVLARERLHG